MNAAERGSLLTIGSLLTLIACSRPEPERESAVAGGASATSVTAASEPARVVIHELMADPAAVPDERGEWVELRNLGPDTVQLRGWRLRSGNDRDYEIPTSLTVPPDGYAVLARDGDASRNGGARASLVYGSAISLANGGDWLALAAPDGATVDSVAWDRATRGAAMGVRDAGLAHANVGDANWVEQTTSYGAGDRGTPGAPNDGAVPPTLDAPIVAEPAVPAMPHTPGTPAPLTVRVLDVGQGDAVLISNGTNTALVDGGPDPRRLGRLLDSLGIRDTTIDVVVLSHPHYDHHSGLRALFDSHRRIRVRYFFETRDPYPNQALAELRDSVSARMRRDGMVLRDADDPCGDGRPTCTLTMNGGARLHVMRPIPRSGDVNDRSVPLKLVGPDSASFTMWLAGDAEHEAIRWFDATAGYDERPGMDVDVLKANHHGSCNGITRRYLTLTSPDWVVASLDARNDYGHVHEQTKRILRAAGVPWYRTDQNGTVTITSPGTPGDGYTITPSRGERDASGPVDRRSSQAGC